MRALCSALLRKLSRGASATAGDKLAVARVSRDDIRHYGIPGLINRALFCPSAIQIERAALTAMTTGSGEVRAFMRGGAI